MIFPFLESRKYCIFAKAHWWKVDVWMQGNKRNLQVDLFSCQDGFALDGPGGWCSKFVNQFEMVVMILPEKIIGQFHEVWVHQNHILMFCVSPTFFSWNCDFCIKLEGDRKVFYTSRLIHAGLVVTLWHFSGSHQNVPGWGLLDDEERSLRWNGRYVSYVICLFSIVASSLLVNGNGIKTVTGQLHAKSILKAKLLWYCSNNRHSHGDLEEKYTWWNTSKITLNVFELVAVIRWPVFSLHFYWQDYDLKVLWGQRTWTAKCCPTSCRTSWWIKKGKHGIP